MKRHNKTLVAALSVVFAGAAFAQTIGPIRVPGSTGITARANIGINQANLATKAELPNLSGYCVAGDARCQTAVLTCPYGQFASGGSCITPSAALPNYKEACPGTQVRSGSSCVEPSTLIPSQAAASGTQCGSIAVYDFYRIGSRVSCKGNTLGMGYVYHCPSGGNLNAGNMCIGYYGEKDDYGRGIETSIPATYAGYIGAVSRWDAVGYYNCPTGYTLANTVTGGGSAGKDSIFTCVAD